MLLRNATQYGNEPSSVTQMAALGLAVGTSATQSDANAAMLSSNRLSAVAAAEKAR